MSDFDEMQAAATEAQGVIAGLMGKSDSADGNFLYNAAPFTGVWGLPQVFNIPLPGGGYRQRTVLRLTVTRTQTDFKPEAKQRITRTDIAPRVDYVIDAIDTHDPLVLVLMLVKLGEG